MFVSVLLVGVEEWWSEILGSEEVNLIRSQGEVFGTGMMVVRLVLAEHLEKRLDLAL